MRTLIVAIGTALAVSAGFGAQAQTPSQMPSTEPLTDRVLACRSIADATQRLACFDQAVGAFAEARDTGDVVVVNREQVLETRRGLFGFNLPSIPSIFTGGSGPEEEEEVREQTFTIASVREGSTGWIFEMEGGAVWRQTEGRLTRRPRPGDTARITRRALGSYSMNVNDARAIWVERVR